MMPTKHTHIDGNGRIKVPHKYPDGKYVVSETKYEKDYERVDTLQEVNEAVAKGKACEFRKMATVRDRLS